MSLHSFRLGVLLFFAAMGLAPSLVGAHEAPAIATETDIQFADSLKSIGR